MHFEHAEEVVFQASNDELENGPFVGRGLDVYGLFHIRNSEWKMGVLATMSERLLHFDKSWWDGFEHFVVRGKGGELSCLARSYKCQEVHEPIEAIRQRAAFWKTLR